MRISRRSFVKRSSALVGTSLASSWPLDGESRLAARASDTTPAINHANIPRMVCEDFTKRIDPAYLSNGLIGIRPPANPLAQGKVEVGGFVSSSASPYLVESLSPAPYPLGMDLRIDGISLLEHPEKIMVKRQTLDLATGELLAEMTFAPYSDVQLELKVLQFASRSVPCLLCQEVSILPSTDVRVQVVARIDVEKIPGRVYFNRPTARSDVDLTLGFYSPQDQSKLGVTVAVSAPGQLVRVGEQEVTDGAARRTYTLQGQRGETYRIQSIAAMVSQFYHPAPELQAYRMAKWGQTLGFETLRKENQANWAELWKSRVKVSGDSDAQRVLDAAFFIFTRVFTLPIRMG